MASSFVGRVSELARLRQCLDGADGGRGRAIFITGDAGAGKSTLTGRFLEEAGVLAPGFRILRAGCSEQYGAGEPYQPFVEAFRDLLEDDDRPSSGWRNLREIAAEVAPHWLAAIPLAGGVISATVSTAAELRKGGTAVAAPNEEALFFQYTELFFAAAAQTPILLFIDDLHWADRATVSLLTHLARRIADERILIVGTYRPADVDVVKHPIREARLELERYGVAEEMTLAPLGTDALRALIAAELGAPPAHELLHWLERNAGTNPLFFTELLRWLVDHGHAQERFGAWVLATTPDTVDVPRSAEATIERRLGRLEPEVLKILEYASVEGNEFGSTTLAMLLGVDELELEESMDPLVKVHRLVRLVDTRELPNGELASIYQFSHSLIKDVLHGSLQGKRRILLHRKVAEILEQVHAGATDVIAHRLALHFDEGRQPARALEFALIGADRAGSVFAHQEAIELIRRALRNAESDADRARALERLGDSLRLAGRHAESLKALSDALGFVEAAGDRPASLRLRRKVLSVEGAHATRRRDQLEASLSDLAEECRQLGAREELCEVSWLMNLLYSTNAGAEAVGRAGEALAVCHELGDPPLLAKAHYNLGRTLAFGGDPASAVPHLRSALAIFEEGDNRYAAGNCHNLLGVLLTLGGDYAGGAAEFNAAATIFDGIGDPASEAHVRSNLGALLTRLGDHDEAESNLRESIRLDLRMDATAWLLSPLENMARLHFARDSWAAAADQWQTLLRHARETGYPDVQVVAHAGLGLCALESGDVEVARACEREAATLLEDEEAWSDGRTDHAILVARLALADDDDATADAVLRQAEDALESRDRYLWACVRELRGEVLARTDPAAGALLMREALETFERMGAAPLVRRATAALLAIDGI